MPRESLATDGAVDTTPLTPRDRQLLVMPSIGSQMPIEFGNGARWTELVFACRSCERRLPANMVRGSLTRPMESVAVVEAIGVCDACQIGTRFLYRLHDDMRITGPREGRWVTWIAPRTAIARALGTIRRWATKL
jgi:hypothetical protein